MRQVPPVYVVIGNGRVATHMCHYLSDLSIKHYQWSRDCHEIHYLKHLLATATHLLVLITDSQIEIFIKRFILYQYRNLNIVHFSGSLVLDNAYSAHPMQTFPDKERYPLDEYRKIPFVLEIGSESFENLLPGFTNPHYYIKKEEKAYYHAMCVLSNNVSTILWQKFYSEMQNKFGILSENLTPFLMRTFLNIKQKSTLALSGPFARGETETLKRDLCALKGDLFYDLFETMIKQFKGRKTL